MSTVNQRCRPVKRCRRRKLQSGSSHCGCLTAPHPTLPIIQTVDLGHQGTFSLFFLVVLRQLFKLSLILIIFWAFLSSEIALASEVSELPGQVLVRVTPAAACLLANFLKKKSDLICKRDIERMIAVNKSCEQQLTRMRKRVRTLKAKLSRRISSGRRPKTRTKIKPGRDSSLCKVIPLHNISTCSNQNNDQDENPDLKEVIPGSSVSGALIKVYLKSIGQSFRAFSSNIRGLKQYGLYSGGITPSSTTLSNWLLRASVAKIRGLGPSKEPCIDIIDHWIGVGNLKLFLMLRIPQSRCTARYSQGQGLKLCDYQVIHWEIMRSSNGEKVAQSLCNVYTKLGYPVGIICDQGGDLTRGIKLLNRTKKGQRVVHIGDISHRMANILKRQYAGLNWFQHFSANVSKGTKLLTNSEAAYLRAPKRNAKARWMNISKEVDWALSMIPKLKDDGNQSDSPLSKEEREKLKDAYGDILQHATRMLPHLKVTLDICKTIMEIGKCSGLDEQSLSKIELELKKLLPKNKVRQGIEHWLAAHQLTFKRLRQNGWTGPIPVSSDGIESLFARFKLLQGRAPQGDPTRLVAILPLLPLSDSAEELTTLIRSCRHKEAMTWVAARTEETIHKKKQRINGTSRKRTKKGHVPEFHERPYERTLAA